MSPRAAAWLAWSVWALCVALGVLVVLLVFLGVSDRTLLESGLLSLFVLLLLTFPTVGALVASRHPDNPIGWIFCGVGLVGGVVASAAAYADEALQASVGPLPWVPYATWLWTWASFPTAFLAATMLFLLFPDGRLPPPLALWRPVAWTAVIGSAMNALGEAFGTGPSVPNSLAVGGTVGDLLETLSGFGFVLLLLGCLASLVSPFLRLRWARGQERQQLKWFAYTIALTAACFILLLLLPDETSGPGSLVWKVSSVAWTMMIVGFLLIPLSVGVAMLRYRLYDIDVIINRTLVYGSLTATLALVYVGSVVGLQSSLRAVTGQESTLAVVASTLAIAVLFNPMRRRMQGFVDRRFYRRKYDAAKTLAAFNARLRDETNLETLSGDVVGVVRETMQPAHASLWLRPLVDVGRRRELPR
jgi:hypothetical protein